MKKLKAILSKLLVVTLILNLFAGTSVFAATPNFLVAASGTSGTTPAAITTGAITTSAITSGAITTGAITTGAITTSAITTSAITTSAVSTTKPAITTPAPITTTPVAATTTDERATVLNALGILRGNGTSYQLEGKLKRNEAATFIVRLLGAEDEVLLNREKYTISTFADVKPSDWFAPYVGYCVQKGIINGYTDNTFRPTALLSEKSFLKMVLAAVGYVNNQDFTWATVFAKAYEVGLVTDVRYKTKTNENFDYTRGQVVDVVHDVMDYVHVVSMKRMIQTYIDHGTITKSTAIGFGFIQDSLSTKIKSFKPIDATRFTVVLNEAVKSFTPEMIQIFETDNPLTALKVVSLEKTDLYDTYVLKTDTQKMDTDYTIVFKGLIDDQGNVMESQTEKFIGYRPDVITSDYFKIAKVKAINQGTLEVYFTHPVSDSALDPSYYSILKGTEVKVAGSDTTMSISLLKNVNNGVSISFKQFTFVTTDTYQLIVNGKMISAFTAELNDGTGDSVRFMSVTTTNSALAVSSINTVNPTTLQVNFNKLINPILAEQVFSYYLTKEDKTPIKITKAVVIQDGTNAGKSLTLTVETALVEGQKYSLLVNILNDLSKTEYIKEVATAFTATTVVSQDVSIVSVKSIDSTTLELKVSRALDAKSVAELKNFQVLGVTNPKFLSQPTVVYYSPTTDETTIRLYFSEVNKFVAGNEYNVFLMNTAKDAAGNVQKVDQYKKWTQTTVDKVALTITSAKYIGTKAVRLTFSKDISEIVPNVSNKNYKLYTTINGKTTQQLPIGVIYVDGQTVILVFAALQTNAVNELKFEKLIDITGTTVTYITESVFMTISPK